jgi:hypothetical protein
MSQFISALLWDDITQQIVAIPYRCFGTIYRSHLKGAKESKILDSLALPEEHISHPLPDGSLNSSKI